MKPRTGKRKSTEDPANGNAGRRFRHQIQPEVREMLDLIAEELAKEYVRLMRTEPGERGGREA